MGFEEFLRKVAPLYGLQWRRFQRKGIQRRLQRRVVAVGLPDLRTYLSRVQDDPEEQRILSWILTVTISRFFRDRDIFDAIETSVIPAILKDEHKSELKIWSVGCTSGEEAFSLSLLWQEKFATNFPQVRLSILGTDVDGFLLQRAMRGRYKPSGLKEVPQEILKGHFRIENGHYVLDENTRKSVEFKKHDLIRDEPASGMDMVLCRNVAFTYFSKEWQVRVLKKIACSLNEGGYLIIGRNERLPLLFPVLFVPAFQKSEIFQKFLPIPERSYIRCDPVGHPFPENIGNGHHAYSEDEGQGQHSNQ